MPIIDLTHRIHGDILVYPGTEKPKLSIGNTIEEDGFRETVFHMYSHTGTHVDAPAHMLSEGVTLDKLPVSQFAGKASVVDCSGVKPGANIPAALLKAAPGLAQADYLLLSAGWEARWGTPGYFQAYPVLSDEAVDYLLTLSLKGIGMDMMSIDDMDSTAFPIHHRLFERGLVVIENLKNLVPLRGKVVDFYALPLHYQDADGAPIRAIAIV